MTEARLQSAVLKRLRALGGEWVKVHGGAFGSNGTADILGCYLGRFVAIELKAPGRYTDPTKGLTPLQKRFLDKVVASGGVAICTDDADSVLYALRTLVGASP